MNTLSPSDRVLVLLSGGLDSTVLVAHATRTAAHVETVTIDYGQRHRRELAAAHAVADRLGLRHDILDLSTLQPHLTSALTGDAAIPHGHYTDLSMAVTVVPNRNAIMLMTAAGVAASRDLDTVVTAVHAGDHPIYPDCRPEFVTAAALCAQLGTGGAVTITAPYVGYTKTDIVAIGEAVRAPVELSWSCYIGGNQHCGRCGTCTERAQAFHQTGVTDPTSYTDHQFGGRW